MIDISKATWEMSETQPFRPQEEIRAGALFIFEGMTKEILVTTPVLQYVGEQEDDLLMIFASYDATLMEALKMITGPTFVIVKMEKKTGANWEQGYQILDAMRFKRLEGNEIGVRLKVRKGRPA